MRRSRITSQERMEPKREKIRERSSEVVTGLSWHTKRTFSGGAISAKGRSPTISRVRACARASR